MQGTLNIMDRTGHAAITFDTDTGEGVADAQTKFAEERSRGSIAFDTSVKPGVPIEGPFKPEEMSDVTMVPAFQGG